VDAFLVREMSKIQAKYVFQLVTRACQFWCGLDLFDSCSPAGGTSLRDPIAIFSVSYKSHGYLPRIFCKQDWKDSLIPKLYLLPVGETYVTASSGRDRDTLCIRLFWSGFASRHRSRVTGIYGDGQTPRNSRDRVTGTSMWTWNMEALLTCTGRIADVSREVVVRLGVSLIERVAVATVPYT
jgi:hypothetical protein